MCFLIDTGSEVTLLSSKIFTANEPHSCNLVGAGGSKLKCEGKLLASITIDTETKSWPCHVVDLPLEGILGADFLSAMGWSVTDRLGNAIKTTKIISSLGNETCFKVDSSLESRLEVSVSNVPQEHRNVVMGILKKNAGVFVRSKFIPGQAQNVKHHIILEDPRPIRQCPYRVPTAKNQEIHKLISEMLELGVIEPCNGPWSSPVVLVKKPDNSSRFCVDYRKLNSNTRKDTYPLPNPQDLLASFGDSKWFCTIDLQSGYWQIPMEPDDRDKTAFVVAGGLYRFLVMPFGLCNAVATFQRYMDQVLKDMSHEKVAVYVDDVVVAGSSVEEMLNGLNELLGLLCKKGLFVKLEKCVWFQNDVKFLGHRLSGGKLSVDFDKIRSISEWPEPSCRRQLRAFLGLANYYRRFVPNFSAKAKPLTQLTSEKKPFHFGTEERHAFTTLKHALTTTPTLTTPMPNKPMILDVDASYEGIGAILSQTDGEGKEHVLEYYSRSLSLAEKNYCITRLELLALVSAAKHFHHYLVGIPCVVRTDHSALTWLKSFRRVEGQLARWIESLQNYQLEIEYRPGKVHQNADSLSRKNCGKLCLCKAENRLPIMAVSTTPLDLEKLQEQDDSIGWIMAELKSGRKPDWEEVSRMNAEIRSYWNQWESLKIVKNVLYRQCLVGEETVDQIVVPVSERTSILQELHGKPVHVGIARTVALCKSRFYWPCWRQDIKDFVLNCIVCRKVNGPSNKRKQALASYVSGEPFARVQIDHYGPLPPSSNGNKYVLVLIDTFSKWVEAIPVPDTEAKTTANALVNGWISRFGVPLEVHSDQGRGFESLLILELSKLLGFYKTRATSYHPESDGVVERFMQYLKSTMQKLLIESCSQWEDTLPWVTLSYRATEHSTTQCSPARCLYGRELVLPVDLIYGSPPDLSPSPIDYIDALKHRLNAVHTVVRRNIRKVQDNSGLYIGRAPPAKRILPGERVLILDPARKVGVCPKLYPKWKGPAIVVRQVSIWVYEVKWKGRVYFKHRNHLCPLSSPR